MIYKRNYESRKYDVVTRVAKQQELFSTFQAYLTPTVEPVPLDRPQFPRTFAPKSESTIGGTFAPWYFRSLELSFVPWNFRSRERKLHGTFALWNFRSQELSFPGTFAPVPTRETYNRRSQHKRM